jgi:hypothetical protein
MTTVHTIWLYLFTFVCSYLLSHVPYMPHPSHDSCS